jgi:hypothetical protein
MMMPYHSEKLNFQIIQIDTDLEMQQKVVTCSMVEGTMNEVKKTSQRYMHYSCENGLHFKMSKISPFFLFVLLEESKCHYIPFELDPQPKYQRNYSQLLITQLDK